MSNGDKAWDKTKIVCYNCKEEGHYKSECPKLATAVVRKLTVEESEEKPVVNRITVDTKDDLDEMLDGIFSEDEDEVESIHWVREEQSVCRVIVETEEQRIKKPCLVNGCRMVDLVENGVAGAIHSGVVGKMNNLKFDPGGYRMEEVNNGNGRANEEWDSKRVRWSRGVGFGYNN
jgi:hypothetical protein